MRGAICSEEYPHVWVEPDTFKNLMLCGEIKLEDKQEIIKRALEDFDLNNKYKNETEILQAFKKYMNSFVVQLNDVIADRLDELKVIKESQKDTFIDSFKEHQTISMNSIKDLAEMSKNTIGNEKYKANYTETNADGKTVIYVKAFLKWLKVAKPNQYDKFKANWKKEKSK